MNNVKGFTHKPETNDCKGVGEWFSVQGFTYIELMVTVFFLLVVAMPMVYLFTNLMKSNVQTKLTNMAIARAEERLEMLKNQAGTLAGFTSLVSGSDPDPFYLYYKSPTDNKVASRSWTVAINNFQARVTVTVTDNTTLAKFPPVVLDTIISRP